jgi:hypothetical protein
MNWTLEGQGIFNNGCSVTPTNTPTPTSTPTPTPTPVPTIDRSVVRIINNEACGIGNAWDDDGLKVSVTNWQSGYKLVARYFIGGGSFGTWFDLSTLGSIVVTGTNASFFTPNSGDSPAGPAGWEVKVQDTLGNDISPVSAINYTINTDATSEVCGGVELWWYKVESYKDTTEAASPLAGNGTWNAIVRDSSGTSVGTVLNTNVSTVNAFNKTATYNNIKLPHGTYTLEEVGKDGYQLSWGRCMDSTTSVPSNSSYYYDVGAAVGEQQVFGPDVLGLTANDSPWSTSTDSHATLNLTAGKRIYCVLYNKVIPPIEDKVTICHATDATSNPYVQETPNASGDVSGHDDHNGPVWNSTMTNKDDWGDIIPPFDYLDGGVVKHYSGKNWDAGQAIWDNGCKSNTQPTDVTVCKQDTHENMLSGWTVSLRESAPYETVNVSPNGSEFTSSNLPLNDYVLRASGTYTYRPGSPGAEFSDAGYSKRLPSDSIYGGVYAPWVAVKDIPFPWTGYLGVMVNNNTGTDWGAYNSLHTYLVGKSGHSGAISFKILDDVYSDNSGSIPVDIFVGRTGITGDDGCYTFTNVAPGTYTTEEMMQNNWEVAPDYSTTHEITVNGEPVRYTFVNQTTVTPTPTNTPTPTLTPTNTPTPTPTETIKPDLFIAKSNNKETIDQAPGSDVTYTLTVTASGSDVLGVNVIDLPPKGFVYRPGSWTAVSSIRGNLKGSITTEPTYHSPGTWILGDMVPGEVVTLTYIADIDSAQNPGVYKDLALAKGTDSSEQEVIANDTTGVFVGTSVPVVKSTQQSTSVNVSKTETKEVIVDQNGNVISEGQVLGASTSRLPSTGADTAWIYLIAVLIAGGLLSFILGLSMHVRLSRFMKKVVVSVITFCALIGIIGSTQGVFASPTVSIAISKPKTPTNQMFSLGFVALDLLDRPVTVKCYKQGPTDVGYAQFGSDITLISGGTSGYCDINSSLLSQNGIYNFYATATADADSATSATSTVEYVTGGPDTPTNYSKDHPSSCQYKISFHTANDSKTVKVEVYRSEYTSFGVNDGSRVGTVTIGPNTDGSYTDSVPDCNKTYYYVIRAYDAVGNGSGVIGDSAVTTTTTTKTVSTTTSTTGGSTSTSSQTSEGAIPVANVTLPAEGGAESVLGEATKSGSVSEERAAKDNKGNVLGTAIENVAKKVQNNKMILPIIFIAALALGILGYVLYKKNKEKNESPKTPITD